MVRVLLLIMLLAGRAAWADIRDPLDPLDRSERTRIEQDDPDAEKSAKQLVQEALMLQMEERLLDARSKLLKALYKDPDEFTAHLLLADYYLRHVGHFRLALRYVKRATELFMRQYGSPPYLRNEPRAMHMELLNLLSNIRLNLDDYEGALAALDDYQAQGYYEPWVPASRAWILMKLERLDEAIKVARIGMLADATPGNTLNVLGILLSMTNEKAASLKVFDEAIRHELSLGSLGSPATPLNNAGEVYRELFQEEQARRFWDRALRLPDGCEHVLPSLNLALLNMEETKFAEAQKNMDEFEACVAQFPLRNGEEHRALVHLARGRIALHTGHIDDALKHLETALGRRQWFGKIGASGNDLRAAAMISMAQALRSKNNHLRALAPSGMSERIAFLRQRAANRLRAWWLMRRARQILMGDLKDLEDLSIRHTDSLLEYQTLGEMLAAVPPHLLEQRIEAERVRDNRPGARLYYSLYLAENYMQHSRRAEAMALLDEILRAARPGYDDAVSVQAALLKMRLLRPEHPAYSELAYQVFGTAQSELLNAGVRLPVNAGDMGRETARLLSRSAFRLDNSRDLPCTVGEEAMEDGEHVLVLSCTRGVWRVKARDLRKAVNNFTTAVFSEDLN